MGNKTKKKLGLNPMGVWHASTESEKLQGRIVTKKKRYFLELYTNKTFESKALSIGDVNVKFFNYPIIKGTGQTIYGRNCTLYNCRFAGNKQLGEDVYRLRYEVEYIFYNASIENENELLVKGADFNFSYLSTWYDGAKSINRLDSHTGIFINGKEELPNHQNSKKTVKITDNINFIFIDSFERHEINLGISYEQKYRKYLRIEFNTPSLSRTTFSGDLFFKSS
jgi:hypothetical protein